MSWAKLSTHWHGGTCGFFLAVGLFNVRNHARGMSPSNKDWGGLETDGAPGGEVTLADPLDRLSCECQTLTHAML